MSPEPSVEIIAKNPDVVGENPLWLPEERCLYWTDNRSKQVYRMRPGESAIEVVVDGYQSYAFTFQTDGSLLLFLNDTGIAVASGRGVRLAVDGLPGEEGSRFNDVLADPAGRVICGVVPAEGGSGSLHSLAQDGTATRIVEGLGMPNGMAFTPDDRGLYVADTAAARVLLYDYDLSTGTLANERTFVDLAAEEGRPDGITVDAEGCLWVAMSGGWSVVRFDRSGAVLQRIEFPARKITSLSFGGEGLGTLYVTSSSRESFSGEETGPEGGALFSLVPGVTGRLDHRSDVRLWHRGHGARASSGLRCGRRRVPPARRAGR